MDEHGGSKLIGIRQIVRLKELLHKWQLVTLGPRDTNGHHGHDHDDDHNENDRDENESGISPLINKRLTEVITCDSDEENCHCSGPPADVPKGYLAVYVGPEHRRFIIPTSYLSHSLFKLLLEKTEEEFGFDHSGALTIPCEIETFKYLLKCMENQPKDNHRDDATSAGNSGTMEDGE